MPPPEPTPPRAPLVRPAGDFLGGVLARWLLLFAGLAMIAAVILTSAHDDLLIARAHRDTALADERHRLERIHRHEQFLAAIRAEDPTLMRTLVQTQFHAGMGLSPMPGGARPDHERDATFWAHLEPPPPEAPTTTLARYGPFTGRPDTLLVRLSTHERYRLWILAAASLCVLGGLLPAARNYRSA